MWGSFKGEMNLQMWKLAPTSEDQLRMTNLIEKTRIGINISQLNNIIRHFPPTNIMANQYDDAQKMQLVEKFREDYRKKKLRTQIIAILMIVCGLLVFILGIKMVRTGFAGLMDMSDSSIGTYLAGIFMIMGGVFLTIAGIITFFVSRGTNNVIPYVRKRFKQMHLEDPENFLNAVENRARIVKCEYCGHQVNAYAKTCGHCGAAR